MSAQLVVTRGRKKGAAFPLDSRTIFDIGSSGDAAIHLDDVGVGDQHCRLYRENGQYTIFDLSGAGIRVNGKVVQKATLGESDAIGIGNAELRFTASGNSKAKAPSMAGPVLEVIEGADKGKTFPISSKPAYVLGRGVTADIIVMDIKCSREHCKVENNGGELWLVDLGATNGTRINGKKLKKKSRSRLSAGDKIKLGYSVFLVHTGENAGRKTTKKQAPPPGSLEADVVETASPKRKKTSRPKQPTGRQAAPRPPTPPATK